MCIRDREIVVFQWPPVSLIDDQPLPVAVYAYLPRVIVAVRIKGRARPTIDNARSRFLVPIRAAAQWYPTGPDRLGKYLATWHLTFGAHGGQ